MAASSLLFLATYKKLLEQPYYQAAAPVSLLVASNLFSLATCRQLLDQPNYLGAAPASLPTASSLLFHPPPLIPSSLTLPHHRPHTHKLRHRRGRRKGGSTVATIGRGWAPTGKLQYISGGRKCSQCSLCPRPADAVTQD
jgi:hypothetical protein